MHQAAASHGAVTPRLIPGKDETMDVFVGFIRSENGARFTFTVSVPPGASQVERDAAAFRALMEKLNDTRRIYEPAAGLVYVGEVANA